MPVHVRGEGEYELFETTANHRILVLSGKRWFAWIEGDRGEILVHSDSDHEKDHTIQKGRFYLVDFEEDPEFKDMPHLFLQEHGVFREVMLPNGLPTEGDPQKKVVWTENTLAEDDLENYLENPAPAGEGEDRMVRPEESNSDEEGASDGDLPIENYDELTVEEVTDRLDSLDEDALRRVRDYERAHKDRKTLREALDRRLE